MTSRSARGATSRPQARAGARSDAMPVSLPSTPSAAHGRSRAASPPVTDLLAQLAALETTPTDELADQYVGLYDMQPRLRRRRWLIRRIAWALQAREHGGLSTTARARLDELMAEIEVPAAGAARPEPKRRSDGLSVGTTLSRTWHGREYLVRVVENGFESDGVVYASLSAVARAITGARWNGRLFFQLTTRRRRS